ncbi:MAG TPA: hypothetical protein VD902_02615 [Symbiobacteriaceae bacterium]|nr:hypothetical protein [Symbiobacteriaceae bacterium]
MANAGDRALNALTQVNSIGFPEFTAKLIGDTVDAVVGATVRQLKSYAELVKELEEGVAAFQAKCVTNESVNQYMADAFPGEGGQSAVAAGQTYDKALYDQLVARFGNMDSLADPGEGTGIFTEENVTEIQGKAREVMNQAAESSYDQLRTLVQMGYARVVFTNGRIKSKLTFDVEARDTRTRNTTDMAQSAFQASAKMGGGIIGSILGVSGSTSYQHIRVRTMSASSVEADKVKGEILGEVEINFATQTFPSLEVQPKAAPPTDSPD